MRKDYDAEAEAGAAEQAAKADDTSALKTEYLDVIISDVRTHNGLTFSVQILNTEGKSKSPLSALQTNSQSFVSRYRRTRKAHAGLLSAPPRSHNALKFLSKRRRPRVRQVLRRTMVPREGSAVLAAEERGGGDLHRLREPGHRIFQRHQASRSQIPLITRPSPRRASQASRILFQRDISPAKP